MSIIILTLAFVFGYIYGVFDMCGLARFIKFICEKDIKWMGKK